MRNIYKIMIWNQTKECMDREQMRLLQGARLKKLVHRVYHHTPFYRDKMQQMGLTPDDIDTIDDIVKLPFTTKQDLRDNYPYGLFAAPQSEIVRLHASSGTTGKPTVVGYTHRDLSIWSESIARCLTAFGTTRDDLFTVAYGYGLFTGGLGLHYGVEHLGATVIPMSTGNTAKHIQLMHDCGSTALACTPSYALYLAEQIIKSGIPRSEFRLRTCILGGEPWTENMRREIEAKLGVDAYNIYGLSEIMGPGVSYECRCKSGSHIVEDHFYPEIIDSNTLEPQPAGGQGELVLTTLTKEGMPLLRYRTKDLCSLTYEPCACGRTNVRMSRIVGRSDDMLIIRGVNVFPSQVLLIGTWRVGQDGQYFMDNSLKTLLADQPHLPVFSVSGSGIGSGAIGGYIPKYENGASEIAGQIADFYKKKPRAVHFDPTENEYRFDLQKLKEFGIAEYKLPSGSIVVDTVEARLQKYESYILILIVIFIVLSLFIAFLYYLYYRNKKLKISLENRGRELIAAKEKAEESDMLKSAFLANMSHEIRTPLNAIVGFSALLGDESISEEDRNVYMGIVNQNSDLLLTLIGDILDISRLETGKISFTLHPENIVAICQQVISTTAHGRKKGVECVFNPPVESFILKTDSQRLSQVLINLLTNASKFTEKGTIALAFEIQKEQRRILFSVSDTGCGIPRERQERVFNRFEKLNEFKQGTGLGLAICKQIVLRFGGNIWIDPEYTEGARFVFSHPIVP